MGEIREGIRAVILENTQVNKQRGVVFKVNGLSNVLAYLKREGMVRKVDRELPLITLKEAEEHDAEWSLSNFTDSLQEFGKKKQRDMLKAGCGFFEELE